MKSFPVCKFTCASCSSSYTGETCCHFKSRFGEHIKKDNKSHILKHLHPIATWFDSYDSLRFKIIDKANSKFDLKIKEPLHTNWSFIWQIFFLKNHTQSVLEKPFQDPFIKLRVSLDQYCKVLYSLFILYA